MSEVTTLQLLCLLRLAGSGAQGRLTVVLDLDGTLVSSFTPARAPRLPAGMQSYVVGRGARINPNGVFVVERPGLLHFFAQLSEFAGAQEMCKLVPAVHHFNCKSARLC